MIADLARVLRALPAVERSRLLDGPRAAVTRARRAAATTPRRDPQGRARLRRLIAWVDRLLPGGGCYRRALLETALDGGAASDPLHLGLSAHGPGHAWLGEDRGRPEEYDVEITV